MGTRSIIGTANDGGFEGRYCHWDGYPSWRGLQLARTYGELGSWQAVVDYAIRPSLGADGYWSSYMEPSQAAIEDAKPERMPCDLCAGTGTRPTSQHWDATSNWARECGGCNGCRGTGQMRNTDKREGFRTDNGGGWASSTEDCGAEWAYLLSDAGITVLSSRTEWTDPSDPECREIRTEWLRAEFVSWTDTATYDWEALEKAVHEAA